MRRLFRHPDVPLVCALLVVLAVAYWPQLAAWTHAEPPGRRPAADDRRPAADESSSPGVVDGDASAAEGFPADRRPPPPVYARRRGHFPPDDAPHCPHGRGRFGSRFPVSVETD